jgi:PTS system nitrogen regulatory IIA component
MVDIASILKLQCSRTHVPAHSRKSALQFAADTITEKHGEIDARTLLDALLDRERLGSTGIGEGIAIPHCRIPCSRIIAGLFVLTEPVDFDAIDGEPVDVLFTLLVPPEEASAHLDILAGVSRVFDRDAARTALRRASTDEALHQIMIDAFNEPT